VALYLHVPQMPRRHYTRRAAIGVLRPIARTTPVTHEDPPMRTSSLNAGAALLALALWGCDQASIAQLPSGPTATSGILATIGPSPTPGDAALFVGSANSRAHTYEGRRHRSPAFDLVITSSRNVNLEHVTIRMIDGTGVGGPTVTVPQAELVERFGGSRVPAGTRRVFTFRPGFIWTVPPRGVAADIAFTDDRGGMQGVTVEGSWP
jgi:hypothetical protein